jgi:hypothetical protein
VNTPSADAEVKPRPGWRSAALDLRPRVHNNLLSPRLALLVLVACPAAVDTWWLFRFRRGFPLDVDESGYMWFSFTLRDALRNHGPHGLWSAFQHEGWVPPLLPSVTAVAELVGGSRQIIPSMEVQLLFFAILVVSTYGIGARLKDARTGLLAAGTVAAVPAVTDFVRSYHMVVSSTAMLTLATFALLATERFRRPGWSAGWGLSLGLTALSRTMMIAFVPALLAAALVLLFVPRPDGRRAVNFAVGLAAFGATSLVWYATSWRPILHYLVDAGYGAQSANYGPSTSVLSARYWANEARGAVNGSLYLSLAVVIVAAFGAALVALVVRARQAPPSGAASVVRGLLRSEALVPALVLLEGYLALTSSRNKGTGFVVPLLPPLIVLACLAVGSIHWRTVRTPLVSAFVLVAVFNVVMKADVINSLSRVRSVTVPVFGPAEVTNGEGYLHQHLANAARFRLGPPTRWLPARERGWLVLYRRLAEVMDTPRVGDPRVVVAATEPIFNAPDLRLAAYRDGDWPMEFDALTRDGPDTVEAYRRALERRPPDFVVTTSRDGPQFAPTITQAFVESAIRSLEFVKGRSLPMPDGRSTIVWRRR